jgi:hypothetical protein
MAVAGGMAVHEITMPALADACRCANSSSLKLRGRLMAGEEAGEGKRRPWPRSARGGPRPGSGRARGVASRRRVGLDRTACRRPRSVGAQTDLCQLCHSFHSLFNVTRRLIDLCWAM